MEKQEIIDFELLTILKRINVERLEEYIQKLRELALEK